MKKLKLEMTVILEKGTQKEELKQLLMHFIPWEIQSRANIDYAVIELKEVEDIEEYKINNRKFSFVR